MVMLLVLGLLLVGTSLAPAVHGDTQRGRDHRHQQVAGRARGDVDGSRPSSPTTWSSPSPTASSTRCSSGSWASDAGSAAPTPATGSVVVSSWPATRPAGPSTGWCPSKVVAAIGGFVLGSLFALVISPGFTIQILLVVGGLLAGFYGPNLYLYQQSYDRAEKIQRSLPDAIDLLTISVESGLGFDAALQQVSRNTTGPLAEEFSRAAA